MKIDRVLGGGRCDALSACPAILELFGHELVVVGPKVPQTLERDVRRMTGIADHEAAVLLSRQTLVDAVADLLRRRSVAN
jgi:hypothetical protein